MTCYRVGYLAGDERAVAAYRKLKTNVDSGTPTFIQDAAIAALDDEEHVATFREEYRLKRDLLCGALADAGLPDCTPASALYVWQRLPEGLGSVEFATRLLDPEIAIVTTPGTWLGDEVEGFGNPGEGHVRFALVPSIEDCERAAERIGRLSL
jgi:LL-diaminopimelate aminotransferase